MILPKWGNFAKSGHTAATASHQRSKERLLDACMPLDDLRFHKH